MSSIQNSYLIKPAYRILVQCLDLREGEDLLVLTDTNKVHIAEPFALLGQALGAEVTFVVMTPRTRHGEEPPACVSAAMKAADAIVAPTTFSVNHTTARAEASASGARLVFMPDVSEEIFLDGSLDIDFLEQSKTILAVAEILDAGSNLTVRSPLGTELTMAIAGKRSVPQTGICHTPGSISPPPCIEVAIAPDEGTLQGRMFVDGAVVPGGVCTAPIELSFESGRIESIAGGDDATRLRELLASYGDPNIYCAVEIGLGMNPNARIGRASSLEDEAEFGTMHVGVGNGITFGSSIRANGHCDLVMRDAIVEVDGKVLLENRQLSI